MAHNYNGAGLPRMPNFQNYVNSAGPTEAARQEAARQEAARQEARKRGYMQKQWLQGGGEGEMPPEMGGSLAQPRAFANRSPLALSVDDGFAPTSATPANPMPFAAFGQRPPQQQQQAPQAVNVINSGFAPRPGSTPVSALPKRSQSQPDRFAVNDMPRQRGIEARPVDINYMGIEPYALKQEQITPSFWGGTPQVKDGSTDYLGGLVNYNPKEGQTGADRMGLAGSTLQDVAAWLDGNGDKADNLSRAQARDEASRKELNTNTARERAQQMLAAAGDDVEAQREALMYGAMKGVDLSDYAAALKYGQPEYKSFSTDQDIYEMNPNGGGRLIRSGRQKAPTTSGGMQFDEAQRRWVPINGYLEQQTAIARARAGARGGAAGSIGVPGLGGDWDLD
jgi:hypothetical protein